MQLDKFENYKSFISCPILNVKVANFNSTMFAS